MTAGSALEGIALAYRDPDAVAARLRQRGAKIVRTIGSDAPLALLRAAGLTPVRLAAIPERATPRADAVLGLASGRRRGHLLLEALLDPAMTDPVLFTRADAEQAQLFSALREQARLGEPAPHAVTLLDLLHIDRATSRAYNGHRLDQLREWITSIGGHVPSDSQLAAAADTADKVTALLCHLDALRPAISGTAMLRCLGAAAILPPEDLIQLLQQVLAEFSDLPTHEGTLVLCTGSAHETDFAYAAIEATGLCIVGEVHDWGMTRLDLPCPRTWAAWAEPRIAAPAAIASAAARALEAQAIAQARDADTVLHLTIDEDEAAPWHLAQLRRALPEACKLQAISVSLGDTPALQTALANKAADFIGDKRAKPSPPPRTSPSPRPRSRKMLQSSADAGVYQRNWFADIRKRVAEGAPFAMVNANAPQEILRAMDVPFVVNQWWASIVAAKGQSGRYRDLLLAHQYPTDAEAYSAQGIAAAFDDDGEQAPWGGLPRPDFVQAIASSDATPAIFEAWAHETGANPYLYERTVDPRWSIETRWWDALPDRWDEALENERLDLLENELREMIASVEAATGHRFDVDRFVEVMTLVNEQEEYYRRTRDLIARTTPAPIGVVDSMPATMVPQWHRGTVWARDAARALYEEVAARAQAGLGAVAEEKVRLMWVGRGLWSNTAFYQKWEDSHGAVFVWSMYLALAADGYIRHFDKGRDPLRALAARFLTMGDELRMPSWAAPWHVHEAQTHGIDGAVALSDADPFVLRALAAAGIPVLETGVDNYALDRADPTDLDARITAFIEGPCRCMAQARREVAA